MNTLQMLSSQIDEMHKQMEIKDRLIREMELRLSDQEKLHTELMKV